MSPLVVPTVSQINPVHACLFHFLGVNFYFIPPFAPVRGGAVGGGTALQVGRTRVRFPLVSLEVFVDIILPAALWSWG